MSYYITFDGGSGTGKGTLISWLEKFLISKNYSVFVLKDNEHDILRDYGKVMIPWCKKNSIEHQTFLLPLFFAGGKIIETKLDDLLQHYDFVLRDRSLISSLAYQPASGTFTPEQILDLYENYMHLRIPDVAIIVDTDIDIATERISKRNKQDIGLGGQMSGNTEKRKRIREFFLSLPLRFDSKIHMVIIKNNDPYIDNENIIQEHMEIIGKLLLEKLTKMGVILCI